MAPPLPTLSTAQFSATLGFAARGNDAYAPTNPNSNSKSNLNSGSTSTSTSGSSAMSNAALDALAHCPLKTIAQYDCVSRQYLVRRQAEQVEQARQTTQTSQTSPASPAPRTRASTRPDLVCHEFLRYFRRCADLPPAEPADEPGPGVAARFRGNVEITALMGVRRSASLTDDA